VWFRTLEVKKKLNKQRRKLLMKVIIAGSRDINDYNIVLSAFSSCPFEITEIVSGCAKGVDTLGEQVADLICVPICKFPADWNKHGKAAGPIRNKQMADYADAAIVIHNGSRGSLNMIEQMKKLNKPVYEVKLQKENRDGQHLLNSPNSFMMGQIWIYR
jgi:predicted Rossmann fold nucleotide-binding protein DprA/Smf involved in DNA uptake